MGITVFDMNVEWEEKCRYHHGDQTVGGADIGQVTDSRLLMWTSVCDILIARRVETETELLWYCVASPNPWLPMA